MTYPTSSTTDPDTNTGTLPGDPGATIVARFRAPLGAIVRVLDLRPNTRNSDYYAADCTGCLDNSGTYNDDGTLHGKPLFAARGWAVKHAEQCRALALAGDDDQAAGYLATAAKLIERGERIAFTSDGIARQMNTTEESTLNTLTLFAGALVKLAEAHRNAGA